MKGTPIFSMLFLLSLFATTVFVEAAPKIAIIQVKGMVCSA